MNIFGTLRTVVYLAAQVGQALYEPPWFAAADALWRSATRDDEPSDSDRLDRISAQLEDIRNALISAAPGPDSPDAAAERPASTSDDAGRLATVEPGSPAPGPAGSTPVDPLIPAGVDQPACGAPNIPGVWRFGPSK